MNDRDITKKMLNRIRESVDRLNSVKPLVNEDRHERNNLLRRYESLMENCERKEKLKENYFDSKKENGSRDFVIRSNDPQFSNLRDSQEDSLRATIGDVELKDDALVYHPDIDDITLDGFVKGLNVKFQFRYNDPSGDGCYITGVDLQLTDANTKTIEKIRSAFQNWKQGLTSDGNTVRDIEKAANRQNSEKSETEN